ncbi:cytochrome P450 family protein [Kitasatospora griseola]|uniref:hypothetical protein n=1 Tax=Kitasatospora griseola TaxID=2064 RepID=UPI0038015F07
MARTVALIHDTGQLPDLLTTPDLIPAAVREGLRVSTPAPVIGWHVSKEVTVAGRLLRKDERILLATCTADNAAGGFDLARPYDPRSRQLWFGAGRHLCLVAPVPLTCPATAPAFVEAVARNLNSTLAIARWDASRAATPSCSAAPTSPPPSPDSPPPGRRPAPKGE